MAAAMQRIGKVACLWSHGIRRRLGQVDLWRKVGLGARRNRAAARRGSTGRQCVATRVRMSAIRHVESARQCHRNGHCRREMWHGDTDAGKCGTATHGRGVVTRFRRVEVMGTTNMLGTNKQNPPCLLAAGGCCCCASHSCC